MLTDEQRKAIEWAIGMASQHNIHNSPLRALLAAHSAGAQEPAAWRHSKTLCLYETEDAVPLADGDEWAEPLYIHPQPITDAARDAKRLDWLCEYVVNVRMPLVYGSKDMFWASPVDDDSGHAPSDLRARIDSEIERLDRAKGE